jgi:hypothetical protein
MDRRSLGGRSLKKSSEAETARISVLAVRHEK